MNLHLVRSKTVFFLTIAIVFFDRVADPDSLLPNQISDFNLVIKKFKKRKNNYILLEKNYVQTKNSAAENYFTKVLKENIKINFTF